MCACTSMLSEPSSASAWSLFFTMVWMTESSMLPVGAPAPMSRVRTIVVLLSRSAWMSVGARRHCVIFEVTSVDATPAAPVSELVAVDEPVLEAAELACVLLWSLDA